MQAKSIKGSSTEEVRSAIVQSMADGFTPTLAIVFISIKQDRNAVCEILNNYGIDIVGATSCGEFIEKYQGEGTTVILLLDLNRDYYAIFFEDFAKGDVSTIAKQMTQRALKKFHNPAFILCSTGVSTKAEYFGGEILIKSIESIAGSQANVFGGMAGDDGAFTGTYVFTNNQFSDVGMVALVLDQDKVDLEGMAISGWKPIGTVKTVTGSDDGWLYSIDGAPALDMYLRYLGKNVSGEGDHKIFEELGFYYPFLTIDAGDPVIRTPLMINKEKNAIKLDFPIPVGKKLQFSMPPDFDIVETVLENANEIKQSHQTDAEALLIFSCAGRLAALGPMIGSENDGLYEIWKAPMAGFFTYGEYGKGIKGKQEFHSTTCCWVVLKER